VTAAGFPVKIRQNQHATEIARAEDRALRGTVSGRAIVLLPRSADGAYVLHPRGALANGPRLGGRVLYAADRSEENIDLFDRFPDRSIYRLQQSEGPTPDHHYAANVRRLHRRELASTTAVDIESRNVAGAAVAQLYATVGLDRIQCIVDAHSAQDAVYHEHVTITAHDVSLRCPNRTVTLARTDASATLAVGIALGPDDDFAHAKLYEYRYWSRAHDDHLTVIEPPEQWRRDAEPPATWSVTDHNPAIAMTLTDDSTDSKPR
jgi:hypothetical protein